MPFDIQNPPMAGGSIDSQVQQLKSWLFQLTDQLRYTLNNIDTENLSDSVVKVINEGKEEQKLTSNQIADTYQNLKALIVKTADYVDSSVESITRELNSHYEAISDYGTFTQDAWSKIEEQAQSVSDLFRLTEEINNTTSDANSTFETYKMKTEQYIKYGLLYYDGSIPRYGIAVGENLTTIEVNGEQLIERDNLVATFTSDRLSFWQQGVEVAYLSNAMLYITNVTVLGNLYIGKFMWDSSNGLALKYVG